MQFGIHALIVGRQFQTARAGHPHGHIGIDCPILLPQLLFLTAVFINPGHMGTTDGVFPFQQQIGACAGGVHIPGGGVFLPLVVTFVDIQKQDGGRHRAGDIHIGQHQTDHRLGIGKGLLTKIHPDLPLRKLAGKPIGARLGDVHHRMGGCLLSGVLLPAFALAVSVAAVIGVPILIINDIMADEHRPFFSGGLAIQGDALVGQDHLTPVLAVQDVFQLRNRRFRRLGEGFLGLAGRQG